MSFQELNSNKKPFVNKSFIGPEVVRDRFFHYLKNHLNVKENELNHFQKIFLFHLIECSLTPQYWKKIDKQWLPMVPIPMEARDKIAGPNSHQHLVRLRTLKLIAKIWGYARTKKHCYSYQINSDLLNNYLDLIIDYYKQEALADGNDSPLVYMTSGKPAPDKTPKWSNLYLSQKKEPLKNVQARAVKKIEGLTYENLELAYESLIPQRDRLRAKEQQGEQLSKEEEEDFNRIKSDLFNLTRLQRQKSYYERQMLYDKAAGKKRSFKILVRHQRFDTPSNLGRIYDLKSAYVNLSGDTKMRLRFCYNNQQLQWNWDLVACYVNINKTLGEKYRIRDPLFKGKDVKKVRNEIAEEIGVNYKLIKNCLNAINFGAQVPTVNQACKQLDKGKANAITLLIADHTKDRKEFKRVVQEIVNRLTPYCKFVKKVREAWAADRKNLSRNKQYYLNAVNRSFEIPQKWERKNINEFQTFILQGIEGCFIQTLVDIQEEYSYEITKLEHDGATIIGKVPEEAIERARQASEFKYAFLELKDNLFQEQHQDREERATINECD